MCSDVPDLFVILQKVVVLTKQMGCWQCFMMIITWFLIIFISNLNKVPTY